MKEWTAAAEFDSVPALATQIGQELKALNCSEKAYRQIAVSVDELFTNIVSYAYGAESGMMTVQMSHDEDAGTVTLTFIDKGIPYNPLSHEDPDVEQKGEERAIGGLGILLVKKKMDGIEYRYENDQNILTVYKRIRED